MSEGMNAVEKGRQGNEIKARTEEFLDRFVKVTSKLDSQVRDLTGVNTDDIIAKEGPQQPGNFWTEEMLMMLDGMDTMIQRLEAVSINLGEFI